MKTLKSLTVHNFGFFGGWREKLSLDGHYHFLFDSEEFLVIKFGNYAGFTSIAPVHEIPVLTDSDIRYVNDYIYSNLEKFKDVHSVHSDIFEAWKTSNRYPFVNGRISANIQFGDTFVDLETSEVSEMSYFMDEKIVNRNHFNKLVDRELHPPVMSLSEFKTKLEAIDPFQGWKIVSEIPKHKDNWYYCDIIVETKTYKVVKNYTTNNYYITDIESNVIYSKHSSISAPYHDMLDLLTKTVYTNYFEGNSTKYCLVPVVETLIKNKFEPQKFGVFTADTSYHYNNRATYLK